MFVETMTIEEAIAESRNDYQYIVRYMNNKERERARRMMCLKYKKLMNKPTIYMAQPITYTTPTKNTYKITEYTFEGLTGSAAVLSFKVKVRGDNDGKSHWYYIHGNCTEGSAIAYSEHSLKRYAERVIERPLISPSDVFDNYIAKPTNNLSAGINLKLPSRTHEITSYFANRGALFLGDYIDMKTVVCNTCLSQNELKYSQDRIMNTLGRLIEHSGKFIDINPLDFMDKDYAYKMEKYIRHHPKIKDDYYEILKIDYMLRRLCSQYYSSDDPEYEAKADSVEMMLLSGHVNKRFFTASPFDRTYGIARKGEIDYKK